MAAEAGWRVGTGIAGDEFSSVVGALCGAGFLKINEQTLLLTSSSKQEILTWTGEGWGSSGPWRLLVGLPLFLEHPWCFGVCETLPVSSDNL